MFDPSIWLAVLGGVLAAVYGFVLTHLPSSHMKTNVKTSATLALFAILILGDAPILVVAALSLGAIGDWFLSRDTAQGFLPGLIAFAIGHGGYAAWLAPLAVMPPALWSWMPRLFGCAVLALLALGVLRMMWPKLGGLKGPVVLYVGLSLLLGGLAAFLPVSYGTVIVIVGVGAFVLSDMLLGVRLFVLTDAAPSARRISTSLWGLYWGGQGCILLGSLSI